MNLLISGKFMRIKDALSRASVNLIYINKLEIASSQQGLSAPQYIADPGPVDWPPPPARQPSCQDRPVSAGPRCPAFAFQPGAPHAQRHPCLALWTCTGL